MFPITQLNNTNVRGRTQVKKKIQASANLIWVSKISLFPRRNITFGGGGLTQPSNFFPQFFELGYKFCGVFLRPKDNFWAGQKGSRVHQF